MPLLLFTCPHAFPMLLLVFFTNKTYTLLHNVKQDESKGLGKPLVKNTNSGVGLICEWHSLPLLMFFTNKPHTFSYTIKPDENKGGGMLLMKSTNSGMKENTCGK